MSLVFTWSVESVLLGLTGLALFGCTWPIFSQLVLAAATAIAHLALAATQHDAHHEVAVSYLCVITGLTVAHSLHPLSSLGEILLLCFFCVSELAALGMTFASCEGSTPLFLHAHGMGAGLIVIALDAACWNSLLGLVVGLVLAALLACPFEWVATIDTAVAAALFLIFTILTGDWVRMGVAAFVLLVCVVRGVSYMYKQARIIPVTTSSLPGPNMTGQIIWPRVSRPVFKDL